MATRRPGGAMATRPLHFFWVCDASASMDFDGKIQTLNTAVREALPHMRHVADQNPNASVLVRTLRFAGEARWLEAAPVPLDDFTWQDLSADQVPRTAAFAAEFRDRLEREGAQSGAVQISLIWNNYNDLDLHVICPSGEEIFFGHKRSRCGGELDVDMNVSPTSTEPVENVYWAEGVAPTGRYRVYVNEYRNHGRAGCQDPTPFRVAVSVAGNAQEFSGRVSHGGGKQFVHEFDFNGQGAVVAGGATGKGGGNTELGAALRLMAEQMRIPPMPDRALPPVIVLVSDGQPTDDFQAGLQTLMDQPWGKRAVRIAIGIGGDADMDVLQRFIGHSERRPVQANNPEALVRYIQWASTEVLRSTSAPGIEVNRPPVSGGAAGTSGVPIPAAPEPSGDQGPDVW